MRMCCLSQEFGTGLCWMGDWGQERKSQNIRMGQIECKFWNVEIVSRLADLKRQLMKKVYARVNKSMYTFEETSKIGEIMKYIKTW